MKAQWIEIKDINGPHKEIFYQSEPVYYGLFNRDVAEEWDHFGQYITDTQARIAQVLTPDGRIDKRKLPKRSVWDHYFVGLYDGEVRGMAFLTTYPGYDLGVISYFGVAKFKQRQSLSRAAYPQISECIKQEARRLLFEIEDFNTIVKADKRKERRRIIRLFQQEGRGARKISWVKYVQPNLEPDTLVDENENLLLMVAPVSGDNLPEYISRERAVEYINFIYRIFYWDGFAVTHEHDDSWQKALNKLCDDVIATIPEEAAQVPYVKVYTREQKKNERQIKVMISYATETRKPGEKAQGVREGSMAAALIDDYLNDIGIESKHFETDYLDEAGEQIKHVMENWVASCDFVIFLFTPKVLNSNGVRYELELTKEHRKPSVVLIRDDVEPEVSKSLKEFAKKYFGDAVFIPFTEGNLGEVLVKITANMCKRLKGTEHIQLALKEICDI